MDELGGRTAFENNRNIENQRERKRGWVVIEEVGVRERLER